MTISRRIFAWGICVSAFGASPGRAQEVGDILDELPAETATSSGERAAPQVEGAQTLAPSLIQPEPGDALEPEDKFVRVPLRPQVSDTSWRKWAGKQLEKTYRLRSGDTLWGVSERLFGNPYLWPKVWQLNAQLGNPHEVPKGLELSFSPGNPNSSPELAFKSYPGLSTEELPVLLTQQELSFLEKIDELLAAQTLGRDPPFKFFLFNDRPETAGKVQSKDEDRHFLYTVGSTFETRAKDGEYSVIKTASLPKGRGYTMRWLGRAKVENKKGLITRAFAEIEEGDLLIARDFWLSPLALHQEERGEEKVRLYSIDEGSGNLLSQSRSFGANFRSVESGPRVGAIMKIKRGDKAIGQALLVDRNVRVGTFWVIESSSEIDLATDRLE